MQSGCWSCPRRGEEPICRSDTEALEAVEEKRLSETDALPPTTS